MEKMRFWKKTAVFAVALAFVLSACGAGNAGSAREESYVSTEPAPTAGYKEASDGAYAAEEAYDSSWDGEEAAMDSDEEYVTMAEESGNNGGAAAQEAAQQPALNLWNASLGLNQGGTLGALPPEAHPSRSRSILRPWTSRRARASMWGAGTTPTIPGSTAIPPT